MPRRSKRGKRQRREQRRKRADGVTELRHVDEETGEVETDYLLPINRPLLDDQSADGVAGQLPADLAQPVLETPGLSHLDDTRLATGISVKQLVAEAERWWTRRGRRAMLDGRKSQIRTVRGHRHYKGPFTLDPDDPNALPSGIIHGLPWDNLNRAEKLQVCKAYHLIKYRQPQEQELSPQLILPN